MKGMFNRIKIKPVQVLAIGFLAVILTGTFLLMLPIATKEGVVTPFIDALFTATSAVCVTGLTTLTTAEHWSYFGTTVIIVLIQIGGLGFMSFATLFALILGKRVSLKERMILQEAVNATYISGIVKLIKSVLIFTFTLEGIGAAIYATQFIPELGFGKGLYFSLFHAISSFCNAGFDLMGDSLVSYQGNAVMLLNTSALIIVGGIGFAVLTDLMSLRRKERLFTHTKFVLIITLILIIGGTVVMYLLEFKNPATLGNMNLKDQLTNAFFLAVSPRTAGFFSMDLTQLRTGSIFLTIILMFIGGSPGSTAGGIKTTTVGLIFLTIISGLRGKEDTELFKRRIPKGDIYKAFTIISIALMLVVTITLLISSIETGTMINGVEVTLEDVLFEATSAFGTVGLTIGLTPVMSTASKLLIILTMYMGRLGAITVVMAITKQKKKNLGVIKYPEGKIMIG